LAEQQAKEEELKKKAEHARERRSEIQKKAQDTESHDERTERIKREKIREIRRLEREREARLANAGKNTKKTRVTRDHIRDISEKIALGHQVGTSTETQFDQRLFNQSEGISSGFGDDEDYDVYDKRLFGSDRETALYKAPNEDEEMYGDKNKADKIANTKRFVPDRDFDGVDRTQPVPTRTEPVQYVKDRVEGEDNDDIYGFNEFFSEAKGKVNKKQQKLGIMHAVAGSGVGGGEGSGRSNRTIGFEKASDTSSQVSRQYAKREERRDDKKDSRSNRSERSPPRRSQRDRSRDRKDNNSSRRQRDRSSSRENYKRSRRDD